MLTNYFKPKFLRNFGFTLAALSFIACAINFIYLVGHRDDANPAERKKVFQDRDDEIIFASLFILGSLLGCYGCMKYGPDSEEEIPIAPATIQQALKIDQRLHELSYDSSRAASSSSPALEVMQQYMLGSTS